MNETTGKPLDRALALLALAALGAHAVAWQTSAAVAWATTGLSVAVALGARRSVPAVRSLTAMLAALALAIHFPMLWQLAMLLAIVAFVALGRGVPALRPPDGWRARGRVPPGWTLLVGGVTPFALSAWMVLFRPNLGDVVAAYIPDLPLALLVVGAVGFAVVNAALEELIWRGVLQNRLEPLFGPGAAIVLQAVSFGVQHYGGVPRGVAGVLLVSVWGVMLGALRRRSGGLLAPFLAHVVADAVIAVIVLFYVR
jgi:membrane protease YdiL (CAAX protease family)